jgi:hypothetical protein
MGRSLSEQGGFVNGPAEGLPVTSGSDIATMDDLVRTFTARGDLAHLALLLWATGASALAWFALRELAAAMRRFDDFVRELARFNKRFGSRV